MFGVVVYVLVCLVFATVFGGRGCLFVCCVAYLVSLIALFACLLLLLCVCVCADFMIFRFAFISTSSFTKGKTRHDM